MTLNRPITMKPTSIIKAVIYAALLFGLYHSAFSYMLKLWDKPQYNYCYFIPFVVLYLIWEKRRELLALPSQASWKGMFLLVPGILFFWLGELGGEYFTLYLSFWLVLGGMVWTELGWQKFKTIGFALFMILTMFPLPVFLYNKISVKLQLLSSKLSVSLMQLYGMSVHREGNIIDLAFTKLQVVEACSGLRSLMSLVVLGLLLAYFFRDRLWKRVLLVLSVIPVSICANAVRLALTGILHASYGSRVAEGFFHGFSGWVVFCLAGAVLLGEMWILKRIRPAPGYENKQEDTHRTQTTTPEPTPDAGHLKASTGPMRSPFVAIALLLALTIGTAQGVDFREKIPINKPLETFPVKIGKWEGSRRTMEKYFVDELDLSDYAIVDYRNPSGESVNLYIAYYESQRKGESIHSPATCLPGSGWIFAAAGAGNVSTPGYYGDSMRVNRAFMTKTGQRQLTYYWFPQRGRILTNAYQLKLFVFWDALTKQRTDGALVRLITPVFADEDVKDADVRLQAFVRLVVPILQDYIPK